MQQRRITAEAECNSGKVNVLPDLPVIYSRLERLVVTRRLCIYSLKRRLCLSRFSIFGRFKTSQNPFKGFQRLAEVRGALRDIPFRNSLGLGLRCERREAGMNRP
jgi:hypothetical protein